jgi:hypothetical protein
MRNYHLWLSTRELNDDEGWAETLHSNLVFYSQKEKEKKTCFLHSKYPHRITCDSIMNALHWNFPLTITLRCKTSWSMVFSIHQIIPNQFWKRCQILQDSRQSRKEWLTCSVLSSSRKGYTAWLKFIKFHRAKRARIITVLEKQLIFSMVVMWMGMYLEILLCCCKPWLCKSLVCHSPKSHISISFCTVILM